MSNMAEIVTEETEWILDDLRRAADGYATSAMHCRLAGFPDGALRNDVRARLRHVIADGAPQLLRDADVDPTAALIGILGAAWTDRLETAADTNHTAPKEALSHD